MTQEEKAKRYDDLLIKLQEAKVDNNVCDDRYCCVIDDIVPELKESENEEIREKVIATIHLYYGEPLEDEAKEMIAWLEKQAEQQKPTDKVEPKFHEGQWITNGDYTWKIVEVKSLDYILQSQDGNIVDDTISHVDEQFHSLKLECSEEDERYLSNALLYIVSGIRNDNMKFNSQCIKETIDWLKSLRPQNTWKPSDLPHWQKSNLPNDNTTGFNSDYFCYKGYNINYKELFEKLPKDN